MAMQIPLETQEAQSRASDPENSAWVSANAGSGKTFVLARRVIRLLLAGTEPSKILCLTFTKAAAAEMSNRVFRQLSGWTELSDDALRQELTSLDGKRPTDPQLQRARRLFARALETPGGLKIQTISRFSMTNWPPSCWMHRSPMSCGRLASKSDPNGRRHSAC
jgi:ATP-dependent helicase/nuclease subunit A